MVGTGVVVVIHEEETVTTGLGLERGMINNEGLPEGVMLMKVVETPGTPLTLEVGTGTGTLTNDGLPEDMVADVIVVTERNEVVIIEVVGFMVAMSGKAVLGIEGKAVAGMVKLVVSLQKVSTYRYSVR